MSKELARRIAVTIGALLIFRLGSHIPLAGISPQIQASLISSGASARISIFALSIIPYLSVAIVIQLVAVVWGRVGALERSGEAGRRKMARFTLILTLLLAAFQAFGVASAIQIISGLVTEPGGWFLLSATATMVGGVFFLVWLSEQITRHGIGNGLALVLFVGISRFASADIAASFELLRQGAISGNLLLLPRHPRGRGRRCYRPRRRRTAERAGAICRATGGNTPAACALLGAAVQDQQRRIPDPGHRDAVDLLSSAGACDSGLRPDAGLAAAYDHVQFGRPST
jgi:hypothetical protein